jgi:hypothetical protein
VWRVLGAIPRQVLGDVLDILTSLVKTEMRWSQLDDRRSHRDQSGGPETSFEGNLGGTCVGRDGRVDVAGGG